MQSYMLKFFFCQYNVCEIYLWQKKVKKKTTLIKFWLYLEIKMRFVQIHFVSFL